MGDYAIAAKGATHCYAKTAPDTIPTTDVTTFLYDLSQTLWSDSLKMRMNGSDAPLTVGAGGNLGGSNFLTHALSVGLREAGNAFPLLGNVYSLIALGRLATTQEIDDTEQWVADKTGVVL
jgi:hypothetical protein